MRLLSHAVSGIRWTGLSSFVNVGSETLRTIVLARFLSPDDFGLMAMAVVVIGLAQIYTDLGISAAIIHRQDTTKNQLSSLYWLNIFSGFILFCIVWLCSPLLPLLFGEPRLLPVLKIIALVFIITPIGAQFEILLQKELAFRILAIQEISVSLASTALTIVMADLGFGVWALVVSFLSQIAFKTILLALIGFSRYRPRFHFLRSDLKGYLSFGLFQVGERSVNYLSQRLDQILIGPLLGTSVLGFYSFAFNLACKPLYRINPILNRVAFPLFSQVQDQPERLKRGYLKLVRLVAAVNAPLLVGLAAVAPWAMPWALGRQWTASVPLIEILCFVGLLRSIGNPVGSLLLAKGRADLGFWWNMGLFVIGGPAVYIGAKLGRGIGVAFVLLVLQLVLLVPSYFFLIRPLIGKCAREYAGALIGPVSTASVAGLIVWSLPILWRAAPTFLLLSGQVTLGFIVYALLLKLFQNKVLFDLRAALLSSQTSTEMA